MAVCVAKCMPQRYLIIILTFLGLTVSYVMRFSFSMSITAMAPPHPRKYDPDSCPELAIGELGNETAMVYDFDWDSVEQGNIKSSFFWGYIITQVPGGILADRWGGKAFICYTGFFTSLFTMITPFAAIYFGVPGMMVIRIIVGLLQGLQYSALHAIAAQWIPKKERATLGGFLFSGAHAGNVISMALTGLIIGSEYHRWPWTFYIFGAVGVVWSIIFFLLTSSSPDNHKYLSEKEQAILDEYRTVVDSKKKWPPIGDIFSSGPVWAVIAANFGHDWGLYALIVDLPKYTASVLHLSMQTNGLILALGYLLMFVVAAGFGYPTDLLIEKGITGRTFSRKLFTAIGSVGPGTFLVIAAYSGCHPTTVSAIIVIGMACMGWFYVSLKVNLIDLSPNYAGFLGSIGNGIGTIAGIVVPIVDGHLTPNSNVSEWRVVMWLAFSVLFATNLVYIILASGEVQPFNESIRQRDMMTVLMYTGLAMSRMLLHISNVEMNNMIGHATAKFEICNNNVVKTMANETGQELDWNTRTQSCVLSSVFMGLMTTALAGGLSSERRGAAPILGAGIALGSLVTLFTPVLIQTLGWLGFIISRVATGHSQGPNKAALLVLIGQWMPLSERSWRGSVILTAAQTGNMLTVMVGYKAWKGKWPLAYYTVGVIGLVWSAAFALLSSSNPQRHPYLSQTEKSLFVIVRKSFLELTPWKRILKTKAVWAHILGLFTHSWLAITQLTTISKFVRSMIGISMNKHWYYLVCAHALGSLCGILSGWGADVLVERLIITRSLIKKILVILAGLIPVSCMVGITYSGCMSSSIIPLQMVSIIFMGFAYPSVMLNPVDMSPNYTGSVGALASTFGAFAGILLPFITEKTEVEGTIDDWRKFIWGTFVLEIFNLVSYLYFGSWALQEWDGSKEPQKPYTKRRENVEVENEESQSNN